VKPEDLDDDDDDDDDVWWDIPPASNRRKQATPKRAVTHVPYPDGVRRC
jgi:hypothetical protein